MKGPSENLVGIEPTFEYSPPMNAAGVESLLDQVRVGLTTLVDLLPTDALSVVDACDRLDLWQDAQVVLADLALVERSLAAAGQPAESPSATDISARRRDSAARVRRRSPPRPSAVTGLLASR